MPAAGRWRRWWRLPAVDGRWVITRVGVVVVAAFFFFRLAAAAAAASAVADGGV